MPIVINEPFVRFELRYGQFLTVIEGMEMTLLEQAFQRHTEQILENKEQYGFAWTDPDLPFVVSMFACMLAYQELYGREVVFEEELRDLSTPDARKMDLFYRGKLIQLRQAFQPGVDWTKLYDDSVDGLSQTAGRYFSCFISYSAKDQKFADKLYRDLKNKGVRCWFAPKNMPISGKILDEIDSAIRVRQKVILVLSDASIASDWVEDEVSTAFEEERQRKRIVLFPIRIDDTVLTANEPWAAKLRARHIGDFSSWRQRAQYKKALERVVHDLENR